MASDGETPACDPAPKPEDYLTADPLAPQLRDRDRAIDALASTFGDSYDPQQHTSIGREAFERTQPTVTLLYAEFLQRRADWVTARNAWASEKAQDAKLEAEIETLANTREILLRDGRPVATFDAIVAGKKAKRKELEESLKKKKNEAESKYCTLRAHRAFLTELATAYPQLTVARRPVQLARREAPIPVTPGPAGEEQARTENAICLIDTADQRRTLDPNTCKFAAQDLAARIKPPVHDLSPGEVTIAGRPVDRRGLTAGLTGAKGSSELSLSLTDNFKWRTPWSPGTLFQRTSAWGYTLGVTTGDKNGQLLSFDERDPDKPLTDPIDRLNAKTKFSMSLFYADYGNETVKSFDARSAKYHAAALKACIEEQAKADAFVSTCTGEQLTAWIFARGGNGDYLHPEHAAGFGDLYFGRPASVKYASKGAGISFDLARPSFSYKDMPEGATPAQLLAAPLVEDERHWTFAVTPYAFFRLAGTDRFGFTVVSSLAVKREYDTEDQIAICPAPVAGQPFSLADCKSFIPQKPERKTVGVPALEGRFLWSGARLGRFHAPHFGFAPKAAFDLEDERWEFSAPLFFATGSDKSLSAGLSVIHRTGGKKDDGTDKKDETGLAIIVGKTFSLDPF